MPPFVCLAYKPLFKLVRITDGRIVEACESDHKATKEGVFIGCLSCACPVPVGCSLAVVKFVS